VTDNDHTDALHGDAITNTLRSAALPFERVNEAAVLTDMVDALTTALQPSSVRRHRRVVAFVAVTVASLGVGGLVAAGPGGFRPFDNDDKPPAAPVFDDSVVVPVPDDTDTDDTDGDDDGGTERITTDPDFACVAGDGANHGQTVSSAAPAPGSNRAAAHSECGKPVVSGGSGSGDGGTDRITTDPDFACVAGDGANHGRTVSSAAATPGSNRAAAHSDCGKPVVSGGTGNGTGSGDREIETDDGDDDNANDDNANDAIPGPPASTPGNPDPGPPAGTGNGNGITSTTTQPAG
jgi:hypothetical protein